MQGILSSIKQLVPWVVFSSLFILIIVGLANRGKLTSLLAKKVQYNINSEEQSNLKQQVDSLYNYLRNGQTYEITFLEFGAKNCSACRRMEQVMQEIQAKFPVKVQVVFLNITLPENQEMMHYYGVVTIPTQVLLNNEAQEIYRHQGFISTNDLSEKIENSLCGVN